MYECAVGESEDQDVLKRVLLEKVRLQARVLVPRQMQVRLLSDLLSGQLLAQLEVLVVGGAIETTPYRTEWVPADWWQAVRERWCPRWWLRRWPVVRRGITTATLRQRVCPHVEVPREQMGPHLEYLVKG